MPQLSPLDVQYRFLRPYAIDFDIVSSSLKLLRRYRRNDIRFLRFRDVVVGYARPFSGNKGPARTSNHLSTKVVPRKLRPLHDERIRLRMQLFADTDFDYHRPQLARSSSGGRTVYPMSSSSPGYERWLRRIGEVETLVKTVAANLSARIRKIETEMERED